MEDIENKILFSLQRDYDLSPNEYKTRKVIKRQLDNFLSDIPNPSEREFDGFIEDLTETLAAKIGEQEAMSKLDRDSKLAPPPPTLGPKTEKPQTIYDETVMSQVGTSVRTRKWFKNYPYLHLVPIRKLPPQVSRTITVQIGSIYRDINANPNPNRYTFDLGKNYPQTLEDGNQGFIPGKVANIDPQDTRNIIKIELIQFFLPDITSSSSLYSDDPYLLLRVPEINGEVYTPSVKVSKPFAVLPYDLNKDLNASFLTGNSSFSRTWAVDRPLSNLTSLTIEIYGSDGNLFNFSNDMYILADVIPTSTSATYVPGDSYSVKTITFAVPAGGLPTGGRRVTFFSTLTTVRYETSPSVFYESTPTRRNELNQVSYEANILSPSSFSITFQERPQTVQNLPDGTGTGTYRGIQKVTGGYIMLNSVQNTFTFRLTRVGET